MTELQASTPIRASTAPVTQATADVRGDKAARVTQGLIVLALVGAVVVSRVLPAASGPDGAIELAHLSEIMTAKGAGWVPTLSWFGVIVALIAAFVFPREERFIQAVTISLGSIAAMAMPAYVAANLTTLDPTAEQIGPGLVAGWLLLATAAVLPWAGIILLNGARSRLGPDWWKWLFLLPASLWIFFLTVFPLAYAFTTSRYAYRNGRINRFVGWDNYRRLFEPDAVPAGLRGAAAVAL